MDSFAIGRSYGVLHLDDRRESVTVAGRTADAVQLSDGRTARVLHGAAPDGSAEEVIRLGEVGALATGGVVRVCHLRPETQAPGAGHGAAEHPTTD